MSERRPLLTRSDLGQMISGYVLVVIALVAWPDKATWTSGAVVMIGFVALIVGWLGWIVIAERRLPRPFRRSQPRQERMSGALVVAFLASFAAFLVVELLRQEWPREYIVFDEPPPAGTDGYVVWDVTTVEIPINVARGFIAYLAVGFGCLVLGDGLLRAFYSWRKHGREGAS